MPNPQTLQGQLNKVLTQVIVPSFSVLNLNASYMAKAQAVLTFEDDFVDQIPSATGIVNSPQPFVMGNVTMNLLRSQTIAALWLAQVQTQSIIGLVDIYSDSTVYPAVTLVNCSVKTLDPGPYDGTDPTVKIAVRGTYYTNSTMWG